MVRKPASPLSSTPRSQVQRRHTLAVYPGTFDPITLGHLDVIKRGRRLFDHLLVAIGVNPAKDHLFPVEERLQLVHGLVNHFPNVSVEAYEGLTVDLVKKRHATAILRGLRNLSDMDHEFRVAITSRQVAGVETVFIMTREEFGYTSSTIIKEIVTFGGDPHRLKQLLPKVIMNRLEYYRAHKLGAFGQAPRDNFRL
jgi:pantetheine-phosphate adenylyltransferase